MFGAVVKKFDFHETEILGLVEITPFCFEDARGKLIKNFSREVFETSICRHDLSEELIIEKSHPGVIRGLHVQRVKQADKLVCCISGHIWTVVVDLRKSSPYFKKWLSFDLKAGEDMELFIPGGCAMGYLAVEESSVICTYSEKFYAEYDCGIRWNDPELGIQWPLELVGGREKIILSDKDQNLPSFRGFMEHYGGLS